LDEDDAQEKKKKSKKYLIPSKAGTKTRQSLNFYKASIKTKKKI